MILNVFSGSTEILFSSHFVLLYKTNSPIDFWIVSYLCICVSKPAVCNKLGKSPRFLHPKAAITFQYVKSHCIPSVNGGVCSPHVSEMWIAAWRYFTAKPQAVIIVLWWEELSVFLLLVTRRWTFVHTDKAIPASVVSEDLEGRWFSGPPSLMILVLRGWSSLQTKTEAGVDPVNIHVSAAASCVFKWKQDLLCESGRWGEAGGSSGLMWLRALFCFRAGRVPEVKERVIPSVDYHFLLPVCFLLAKHLCLVASQKTAGLIAEANYSPVS